MNTSNHASLSKWDQSEIPVLTQVVGEDTIPVLVDTVESEPIAAPLEPVTFTQHTLLALNLPSLNLDPIQIDYQAPEDILPELANPPLNIEHILSSLPNSQQSTSATKIDADAMVTNEQTLINALYDAILPRMKGELSLWLQEALHLQTQRLTSDIMHNLRADYEMLMAEALKEGLRQALHTLQKNNG